MRTAFSLKRKADFGFDSTCSQFSTHLYRFFFLNEGTALR